MLLLCVCVLHYVTNHRAAELSRRLGRLENDTKIFRLSVGQNRESSRQFFLVDCKYLWGSNIRTVVLDIPLWYTHECIDLTQSIAFVVSTAGKIQKSLKLII